MTREYKRYLHQLMFVEEFKNINKNDLVVCIDEAKDLEELKEVLCWFIQMEAIEFKRIK